MLAQKSQLSGDDVIEVSKIDADRLDVVTEYANAVNYNKGPKFSSIVIKKIAKNDIETEKLKTPPSEAAWDPCARRQHSGSFVQGTPEPHTRLASSPLKHPDCLWPASCTRCHKASQLGIPQRCLLCFLSF